jgi:hypothetical protein
VGSLRFRWRDYRTSTGARPVKEFVDGLTDEEAATVVAAMKEVVALGLAVTRHLRDDIHEVRAESERRTRGLSQTVVWRDSAQACDGAQPRPRDPDWFAALTVLSWA